MVAGKSMQPSARRHTCSMAQSDMIRPQVRIGGLAIRSPHLSPVSIAVQLHGVAKVLGIAKLNCSLAAIVGLPA